MAETAAEQDSFAYIPLSSLIILLVILLTCASRRKKIDTFNAIEQNFENDIKEEYAVMCFPCLKKKPDSKDFEPIEDLSNQFEYIVEKYTIRKVPLLLANTVEDIIERREEMELAKAPQSQPQLLKDDFVNFQVSQEVYNIQRIPPCITVAANTACPAGQKQALKERVKPADILESMSPVTRPSINNHNYVVIPTKGSLRHKDIMMTKREITNQYLNNFSSVFVDNLKDQVPKDPEQFPSLSRPYTSAFKSFPIDTSRTGKNVCQGKRRKGKPQKVAYAFSVEESDDREEASTKEDIFTESGSEMDVDVDADVEVDVDAEVHDQTSDVPESEYPEDLENLDSDFNDKTKSLVLLEDSDSMLGTESVVNPFKTTIKSSGSMLDERPKSRQESEAVSVLSQREGWPTPKNVTYEDIQALDVGYEFTSCEKLGVKPKMTRIPYPLESEKFKESLKLAFGDSGKLSKKCYSQEQPLSMKGLRTVIIKPPCERTSTNTSINEFVVATSERNSSKSMVTETSFLPHNEINSRTEDSLEACADAPMRGSTSSFCKSEDSKSHFTHDNDYVETGSGTAVDSVTEISKLYDLSRPIVHQREQMNVSSEAAQMTDISSLRSPIPSKSRSFQESPAMRRESGSEVKGKNNPVPYQNQIAAKNEYDRLDEPETETTCSLYSRESKTSSVLTTGMSSEADDGKRATLRWKIVIKHHREDDSSKKNVNVNIRH